VPSISQQVREAIITEVKKVANIGAVSSDWEHWNQETRFPAAFVILDSDVSERLPTRSKEVSASFLVACILQSEKPQDDFDTLRAGIENQIEDDPALGGLVIDAWVSGVSSFSTSKTVAGQVYIRDVLVNVIYRHARGAA